jgi:hypothetical protein
MTEWFDDMPEDYVPSAFFRIIHPPVVVLHKIPHCRRCGGQAKEEGFGYSCQACNSLLYGDAVEWKETYYFNLGT